MVKVNRYTLPTSKEVVVKVFLAVGNVTLAASDSIKYKMPKQDFIVPSLSPVIEIDKNYLIIKLPIHEVGKTDENDKDYGINIVYPVGISS